MNLVTQNFRYASEQVAAHQLINVYLRGTSTKALLYQDEDGLLAASNPVRTDAVGNVSFYITPGNYDFEAFGVRVPFDSLVFDAGAVADLQDDLVAHVAGTTNVHGIVDAEDLDARTAFDGVTPLQWYMNGKA